MNEEDMTKKIMVLSIGQGLSFPFCKRCLDYLIKEEGYPSSNASENTLEELKELNPDVDEELITHCKNCGKYLL